MELSQVPAARSVQCPQCRQALPGDSAGVGMYERCPNCRSELQVWHFPSLTRPPEDLSGRAGATVALPGEAACFFHPEKRASIGCERCGRFICTLCDLQVGSRHLCPSCIGSGLESEKVPELVNRRFVWGSLALILGWLPLLLFFVLWPFYIGLGPAAIFAGIWSWKKPGSVVRGARRWAAILGIIGGLLQLGFVGLMAFSIWSSARERGAFLAPPKMDMRVVSLSLITEHPTQRVGDGAKKVISESVKSHQFGRGSLYAADLPVHGSQLSTLNYKLSEAHRG